MGSDWNLLASHTQIQRSSASDDKDRPTLSDKDGTIPNEEIKPSEAQDPFMIPVSDLKPTTRLLKIVKSGEKVPVTFRYYSKTTALRVGFPVPLNFSTTILYGIEYDDARRGKHEGVYEGQQLFECRQRGAGAGAFLLSPKDLRRGYTFAEALADRYDVDIPGVNRIVLQDGGNGGRVNNEELKLGSSGIVVEAPGLEEVQKRLKHLGRLQSIGLEGYHVSRLGGNEDTKTFLRDNLTSLITLDLSDDLLTFWSDVADIVACIPSLRKIILNRSRIEQIARYVSDPQKQAFIRESLGNIRELELCDSFVCWEDVMVIAPFLPHLERLDLVDNKPLMNLEPMRTSNGVPVFLELKYLNLSGCGISDWETLMVGIRCLNKLGTLDLSNTPLTQIPPPSTSTPSVHLPNLILLSTKLSSWHSIDALHQWIGQSLSSLKFSLSPQVSEGDGSDSNQRISGDQANDRSILIAKLPGLTMLNSSPISTSERRDAEIRYIKIIDRLAASGKGKTEEWGRYEDLKRIHGTEETKDQVVDLRLGHLRSRLYNLTIFTKGDKGIYQQSAELSILPSAPISLLRKKIYKALGKGVGQETKIWTVSERFSEAERGKANEVPDGEVVEWWFADGDEIVAE